MTSENAVAQRYTVAESGVFVNDLPLHMNCRVAAATVDDLMRAAINHAFEHGVAIRPTKGAALDIIGASLVLTNPRARLSRSETRGKAISAIAELCWYLAGSEDLSQISYYLSKYGASAETDGSLLGAYGPRIIGSAETSPLRDVVTRLKVNSSSRQAVVQILRPGDLTSAQKDVPCTIALQFLLRDDYLTLVTTMRSNDMVLGLPHDVFAFTMLQEIVATALDVEVGPYFHNVGSLHLYESDFKAARAFLDEGFQPTDEAMPAMPKRSAWKDIAEFVDCEAAIRGGASPLSVRLPSELYWRNLAILLACFSACVAADVDTMKSLASQLSDSYYQLYVDDRIDKI